MEATQYIHVIIQLNILICLYILFKEVSIKSKIKWENKKDGM